MAIASEIDWDNLPVIDSDTPVGGTGEIDWDNLPVVDDALAQPAAHPPRMTREERIAANNRAIETARSQKDPGFLSAAGDALAEGAKGAARAVKSIGSGIVGMVSGAVRLAGTPVRLATGWEGLHRLADTIDSSYENFGADALMSDYGENPDGFGFAAGRFGEKLAGTAGSLAALDGVGKAVGAAGTALKAAGHAKTAAAVANTLPLMFGNDAAVRAYDTARANGKSKTEAAALAGLNGAIHFLFFKMFENQSLKKMLNIGPEVEVMMPKWADEAAEVGGQSFSSLARGVRNGMVKYIAAENGKRALKAGGIMGLQNFLSDPVMQVAEGASIDDIDFSRMLKAGASGLGEGALMEGALGAAAVLKSPSEARKFIADKYFRGKDYKVMGADGKMHDEPGLLNTSEGRMVLMKQNPDATERVLDIVEHGGTPRPAELDAAFLPPDMTAEELKKFASDWRNDLKSYVDEAWAADAPRQTSAPDAAAAEPGRDMLSPEEAQSQQKAANDAAERQKVADRRAAADSMMLDFESWNRLYADGKTDLNFDEWRAAGKPGVIEANLTPKTEEAPTSETRANEEPAQPEQAEVVAPAEPKAAEPVEGAEARPEAPDAGVVEKPTTVEGLRDASDNATKALQEAEGRLSKWLEEHPRQVTDDGRTTYGNGGTVREFRELEAAVDAAREKADGAESEYRKARRAENAEREKIVEQKKSDAKARREQERQKWREENPVTAQLNDISKNTLLPAENALEDLLDSESATNEQKAEAWRKVKAAEKVIADFKEQHKEELAKEKANRKAKENASQPTENGPTTAPKPTEVQTPAEPAKPVEAASRVSYATPERKAPAVEAEDAPLPSFLAPETAPAEPPSAKPAPKSKRLRRADGTDPLAEKEKTPPDATEKPAEPAKTSDETTETRVPQAVQTGEVSSPEAPAPTPEPSPAPAEPTPVKRGKGRPTMTPEQKAKAAAQRAADKVRKIADISRDKNGAFRTDMLKVSESNPGGLSLKELASLKADKEWHRNLGLPEKDADALRAAVEKAHDDKYLEYHYQSAHDKFADYERGNGDLAFAYNAVSDAASRAKAKGDTVGEQLLQPMLKSLTDKIGALPKNEQNKILAKSSREADTLAPKERKNRKSLTTKEGKEVDAVANDDSEAPRSAAESHGTTPGSTGTGGSLGGNRHLIIDGVKGDELTVTMKDAAGKTLATRKMNRAQWSALSQGAVATDGDPANPQKGDLIRMSRNGESPAERNFRFASDENYQKWLKSRKANDAEPQRERYEREGAKLASERGKQFLRDAKMELHLDREYDPEVDGDGRTIEDPDSGRVVGTFNRKTNELKLFRGATIKTLVHELGGHATLKYAEQLAKQGDRRLLDRINRAIDEAPQTLKDEIRSRYPGADETALRDEIWAALRERNSPAMEKAIKTLQGKAWYNRAWSAFRDAWKGLLARMGFNRADLSQIDKMSNDEFLSHLDRIMSDGKTLGRLEAMGEGTRNAVRKGVSAAEDAAYMDAVKRGDMEKAQRMVREAAKERGYEVFGLHGTKGEFTVFDKKRIGTANDEGWLGRGFYFWDKGNRTYAEQYANGGKVMEVMLSMKEPYLIDKAEMERLIDAAERHDVKMLEDFSNEVKANGYDSVIDGDGQMLVFEPNQIKSADPVTYDDAGNVIPLSQRFNQKSEDIRYSRSPRPAGSRIMDDQQTKGEGTRNAVVPSKPPPSPPKIDMSKDESLKEKYLRNMSDRYDPLKRLVEEAKESAAKPSDVPDPYHEKRVQSGHNEADRHQIDMLKNKYVDFLKRHSHGQKEQEKLHEEVNMYLRARDALYRNPEMKKRLGVDDGSGMSDAQAHKILDDFKRRMRTPILDQAFKIMQEVKKTYGLQRLVDGGMLDQATADMLEKRNPDYAPQRTSRLDEEGIDRNSTRNMEAAAIKKALGRSTLSDNPVEFLFLQASDAAARTNENRTRQEMAKFVRMFPEVGKVRTVDKTSAYDLKTGKDAWIEDPHDVESENPLVVSFRENGKRMRIEFADTPRGRLLAESMRNEGVNRGPEAFNRMTRAWASTATQLSATFSGRNFLKDTVEVALNSAADTGFSGAGKFLKAQIAQMKPVVSTIREYLTKGTFGGPLGKEFKEFIDAGGSIGGMGREGYEDLKDTFSRKAKGLKMAFSGAHGVKEKVEAILGVTFGKIEDFNKTIEMMSRFNNYRSRRAKGESEKEAVIGSREDSTDFNMYGQQRWLNDVYMFSNSILGGTLRSTKQLATGKNGLKVATAVLAYGFVEAAADVLRNWGDDDEAEKSGLGGAKDLSERERSQTLYFRYGGKYFRIPVHGGPFSALKYTGGLIARAALGKLSWSDAAKNAGKEWATIGTHFGGAGEIDLTNGPKGIVSSFTPSVARPVAELGMNQDFAGRHIYAPEGFDRTTPKSERGFKSTGDGYKWFARLMNKVGGGNESRSADWSWFDNPPEAYKHIVEAVGKNMVRDIMLGGETAGRAVESAVNWENRFTRDDVPFLRDVTRNVPDNSRRYYNALEDYERDKAEFKKTTPERRREMKSEKPYLFTGKSLLDGQIERIKELTHLERGEVKVGQKWVEPKTPRTEEQKEKYRKLRLEMQARVLKRLGE